MVIKGLGVAAVLFMASAQLAVADFQKGQDALSRNDVDQAVKEWQSAATNGDAQAQLSLGKLYEKGAAGMDADLVEAYGWLKLAAAQGVAEAEDKLADLKKTLTPTEIEEGQARATSALGKWYRNFTGFDEKAFQISKTEADRKKQELRQQELAEQKVAADERAEAQSKLIEQRKEDARLAKLKREKERQKAIEIAQQQAEEAKRLAALRDKEINAEKQLTALKLAERQEALKTEAARQRLQELRAKQSGATTGPTSTVIRTEPAQQTVTAATEAGTSDGLSAPAPKAVKLPTPQMKPQVMKASAGPKVAAVPDTTSEIKQAVLIPVPAKKPGGDKIQLQEKDLTDQKIVLAATETVSTDATSDLNLGALENLNGLDEEMVAEIFEMAESVPLKTDAAQREISESLVRIDALKWSLISGAQGDKSAPKMNRVLMSKMSPVQIAEANRLARDWLIDRQKRL